MPPETYLIGERPEVARLRAEMYDQIRAIVEENARLTQRINALSFIVDDQAAELQELKGWSEPRYSGTD